MKVGVVTINDITNFGNRLQNYALCRVLQRDFGCDPVTLVPVSEKRFHDGNPIAYFKERTARALCAFPKFAERRFGNNITRWAAFEKWNKNIPIRRFYGCDRLPRELNDKYDIFFVGSDQVWNPSISATHLDDFFLSFADEKKRVALCASIGMDSLPEESTDEYRSALATFSHISVRENAACNIVSELLGRDSALLCDPVMMLETGEWLRVSEKPRADTKLPYVLKYYLGDEDENDSFDKILSEKGYRIYSLLDDSIPELYSAGPGEFISLVADASLVLSDSFHCIAFAILFGNPFVVFDRKGEGDYMGSRLDTLLDKFGFNGRRRSEISEHELFDIDRSGFDERLFDERLKFSRYVEEVLKSI